MIMYTNLYFYRIFPGINNIFVNFVFFGALHYIDGHSAQPSKFST